MQGGGGSPSTPLSRYEAQQLALPPTPKPASSDASLRNPTNYLMGAKDSWVLQGALRAMQNAEKEASFLQDEHLKAVQRVGTAASDVIAKSDAATLATTAALAALETSTASLKLGFNNGASFCGCVRCPPHWDTMCCPLSLTPTCTPQTRPFFSLSAAHHSASEIEVQVYQSAIKALRDQCQQAIQRPIRDMASSAKALEEAKRVEGAANSAAKAAQKKADAATEAFSHLQMQEMERGAQKAIDDFTSTQAAAARSSEEVLEHAEAIHSATVKALAATKEELLRLMSEGAYLESLGSQLAANVVSARAVAGVARENLARARAEAEAMQRAVEAKGASSKSELHQQMLARLQHDRVTREAVRAQAAGELKTLQAKEEEARRAREADIARARQDERNSLAGMAVVKAEEGGCFGGNSGRLLQLVEAREAALRSLRAKTDHAVESAFARERASLEASHKASLGSVSTQAAAAVDKEYVDVLKHFELEGVEQMKAKLIEVLRERDELLSRLTAKAAAASVATAEPAALAEPREPLPPAAGQA